MLIILLKRILRIGNNSLFCSFMKYAPYYEGYNLVSMFFYSMLILCAFKNRA